jgi:hypothetical protein
VFDSTTVFIAFLILGIFAVDAAVHWWRDNAWKRRWRRPPDDNP